MTAEISYAPKGSLKLRWKLIIVFLLLVAYIEGWMLRVAWDIDKRITPQSFSFYDPKSDQKSPKAIQDQFISAQGVWASDTRQYFAWQCAAINCYRDWGYCIEAEADFKNGVLIDNLNNYKITKWGNDAVEALEDYECARTILRFDRISKAVTAIHSGKGCYIANDTPALFHLVDGLKERQRVIDSAAGR